jgi:hypothetical protein
MCSGSRVDFCAAMSGASSTITISPGAMSRVASTPTPPPCADLPTRAASPPSCTTPSIISAKPSRLRAAMLGSALAHTHTHTHTCGTCSVQWRHGTPAHRVRPQIGQHGRSRRGRRAVRRRWRRGVPPPAAGHQRNAPGLPTGSGTDCHRCRRLRRAVARGRRRRRRAPARRERASAAARRRHGRRAARAGDAAGGQGADGKPDAARFLLPQDHARADADRPRPALARRLRGPKLVPRGRGPGLANGRARASEL